MSDPTPFDEMTASTPLVACCIDDSPNGLLALIQARRLWSTQAQLVLVHVAPLPLAVEMIDGVAVARRDDLNAEQRRWLTSVGRREPDTQTVFLEGLPGPEICNWAAEAAPDVVVVASHGRGRLERALMGSVARHVVEHCTRPVLMVPATTKNPGPVAAATMEAQR